MKRPGNTWRHLPDPHRLKAELELGFKHLGAGRLANAARHAKRVLAANPCHHGALNLAGLVAIENGHCELALEHLSRATRLAPDEAIYHANLGVALRQAQRHDDAIAACQKALRLQSDYQQARVNLGVACYAADRYEQALAAFEKAARAAPDRPILHAYRGDALRELGRIRQAIAAYEQALTIDHGSSYALGNLGLTLLGVGQPERAEELCRRATETNPEDSQGWMNLGTVLRVLGRLDEAMDAYATGRELDENSAELCALVAGVWLETGDAPQAIGWYQQALEINPELLEARCGLAAAALEVDDPTAAVVRYREILADRSDCAAAQRGLGAALWDDGDAKGAIEACQQTVALRPEDAQCLAQLASVQASAGAVDAANQTNRQALEINPRCAPALTNLAQNLRGDLPQQDVDAMQQLLASKWPSDGVRASLHFGLGHYFDGCKDYDRAAKHVVEANRLHTEHKRQRGWNYDPEAYHQQVQRLVQQFTPEWFAATRGLGNSSEVPVFVVGMPRSGTTLTEQILASHPRIFGVGERHFANRGFASLPLALGTPDEPPLACLDRLPVDPRAGDAMRKLATWHLEQLRGLADKAGLGAHQTERIVDKMPDNYSQLGWIATLFPGARIIHCRRDVRDVAVSCWVTQFKEIRWAFDLEYLAERIMAYRRLMEHWRKTLPLAMLEIDYEQTVADQAGQTARLLEFVGVEWDDRCLEFHKTERLVRTASVTQVRQPIYRRSVERWRRYENTLAPLLERLAAAG